MKTLAPALTGLLLAISMHAVAQDERACGACNAQVRPDECLEAPDPLAACERRTAENPYALTPRISLCDAHIARDDLMNAIITLRQGIDLCGDRSSYTCSRLQMALSNVEECDASQAPDLLAQRQVRLEVSREYCERRSSGDTAVKACNEALVAFPDDPAILVALGDKHLRRGETALAVGSYRHALELAPEDAAIRDGLAGAEEMRREQARSCLASRDLAMCNAAVLSGEPDEFEIQLLRAELAVGDPAAALEALLIAQNLEPNRREVADLILPLVRERLAVDASNPALRQAEADALLTLGRVDEAIVAYRSVGNEHLARSGGVDRLKSARKLRASRVQEACLTREDFAVVPACEALILAGEPDSGLIRAHVVSLEEAERDRLEQQAELAREQERLRQEALARAAAAEAEAASESEREVAEPAAETLLAARSDVEAADEEPAKLTNLAVEGRSF